mmetsp:Transcript_28570/g.63032  ORF Transcript_28570/g.63032 Transcript_28570/m.63032 type:complete len:224 (-) Transcript_28570:194-865(-)
MLGFLSLSFLHFLVAVGFLFSFLQCLLLQLRDHALNKILDLGKDIGTRTLGHSIGRFGGKQTNLHVPLLPPETPQNAHSFHDIVSVLRFCSRCAKLQQKSSGVRCTSLLLNNLLGCGKGLQLLAAALHACFMVRGCLHAIHLEGLQRGLVRGLVLLSGLEICCCSGLALTVSSKRLLDVDQFLVLGRATLCQGLLDHFKIEFGFRLSLCGRGSLPLGLLQHVI